MLAQIAKGFLSSHAFEKQSRLAAVLDLTQRLVSAFFGKSNRRRILRIDDAAGAVEGKIRVAPREDRRDCLGCVAFSVC